MEHPVGVESAPELDEARVGVGPERRRGPVTVVVAESGAPGIIRLIASPLGAIMVRLPQTPGRVQAFMRQAGHGASLDAGRT